MSDKDIPNIPQSLFDELLKHVHTEQRRARQRDKDKWIAKARALFEPSDRQDCHICKRFSAITHAHHVVPLADQFNRGYESPDHEHVWLCPNHHAIVHRFLAPSGFDERTVFSRLLEGFKQDELRALHDLLMRSRKGLTSP